MKLEIGRFLYYRAMRKGLSADGSGAVKGAVTGRWGTGDPGSGRKADGGNYVSREVKVRELDGS